MGSITLQGVHKAFGDIRIIQDVDLSVEEGSFVVFVGPSGCGKSTLLRLIAGLEDVSDGRILIDGQDMTSTPPARRGLSMVFQSYALYPHMSVRGNIGFGLRMASVAKPEIERRVAAAAEKLNLTPYLDRKPRQLSGGQRQRVAIGRAIVREPKAFLFDEPLSNLDAALRVQMRLEIARLQKSLATTTVYVTHDQVEAMTMADRIVVLNAGRIEQTGTPLELYERPANLFVAGFIGSPRMNFLTGAHAAAHGCETVGFRPEHIAVARVGEGLAGEGLAGDGLAGDGLAGAVSVAERLGSDTLLYVDLPGGDTVTARAVGDVAFNVGDAIALRPDPARIHRFDATGKAIR